MNGRSRQSHMKLGGFVPPPGHHVAAWRMPGVDPGSSLDVDFYRRIAQRLEEACFDFLFLSDGVGIRTQYADLDDLSKWGRIVQLEPLTLMAALSIVTSKIGLVATASTSYNEPFNLARKFSSLDFISRGRIAWNIVTSVTDAEAQNFGLDRQPEHEIRYRRASEFMQVVDGLWKSWDQSAFVHDKARGRFFDPTKARILNHSGESFKVRGPLNLPRSPQGRPVLVQAGSSDTGMDFAAKWADVVFTAQTDLADAKNFYSELKERVELNGRKKEQVYIMPGVFCFIADTQAEAESRYDEMQKLVHPDVASNLLMGLLGDVDISALDLDLPLSQLPETQGSRSRQNLLIKKSQREHITLRQLMASVTGGRGHLSLVGTPQYIADSLEEWFNEKAVDGFNIMPSHLPEGLDRFVDSVVPILQERKLLKTKYESITLRNNLGLDEVD